MTDPSVTPSMHYRGCPQHVHPTQRRPDVIYACTCGGKSPLPTHLDFCAGGNFCVLDDCLCECHYPVTDR